MTTSAIAYCRCSTTGQAEDGLTLAAQEAQLRAYADAQGFKLAGVVVEAGVSASVPLAKREGGQQLEALLRKHKGAVVLATKLDRLWRKTSDALASIESWERRGVGLVLLDLGGQALDTRSPMGKLMLTMLGGFAECERALIAERTRTALHHKKKDNKRVSFLAPLGFCFDGDELVVAENEQATLAKVKELRGWGFSWAKIAAALNKDPNYQPRGQRWYAESLRRSISL